MRETSLRTMSTIITFSACSLGEARRLSCTNFGNALDRLPLENTRSVADLQGSSYVYSILMDRRISQGDW
jgi:hypothetical protein